VNASGGGNVHIRSNRAKKVHVGERQSHERRTREVGVAAFRKHETGHQVLRVGELGKFGHGQEKDCRDWKRNGLKKSEQISFGQSPKIAPEKKNPTHRIRARKRGWEKEEMGSVLRQNEVPMCEKKPSPHLVHLRGWRKT